MEALLAALITIAGNALAGVVSGKKSEEQAIDEAEEAAIVEFSKARAKARAKARRSK